MIAGLDMTVAGFLLAVVSIFLNSVTFLVGLIQHVSVVGGIQRVESISKDMDEANQASFSRLELYARQAQVQLAYIAGK